MATKKFKSKVVHITGCDQVVNFEETGEIISETHGKLKAKLHIHLDSSYRFQCSARVYIWSAETLKWNMLFDLPYGKMKTKDIGYTPRVRQHGAELMDFKDDRHELLTMLHFMFDIG